MMELRDPVSSLSHLFTAVWALYATLILWRIAPPGRRLPAVVYGATMVLLYLASGVFHGVPYTRTGNPDEFRFFQRLDQSAIYLLVAGTSTPTFAIVLQGAWRRWFLSLTWGIAALGIGCLWLLPKAPHELIVSAYLAMGWLGVVPLVQYYRALGWRAMNWVWLGGILFTIGAACELAEWPTLFDYPVRVGPHEILHLFDTAGSMAFFVFVVRYVLPFRPEEPSARKKPLPKSAPAVALPALAGRR